LTSSDTFAVMPVAQYEPPTRDIQNIAPCRTSSHATLRRRAPRGPGQLGPHPQAAPMSPATRQAAIFADAALRRVLEVIDCRRPAAQLRPLLAPSLVDSVLSAGRALAGSGAASEAAAVLRRMRVQPVGRHDPDTHDFEAAEVFGTYSRGDRVHAIACRVEQIPIDNGMRWLVVALHIG
jgi:Family of unknown function (DUF6459)